MMKTKYEKKRKELMKIKSWLNFFYYQPLVQKGLHEIMKAKEKHQYNHKSRKIFLNQLYSNTYLSSLLFIIKLRMSIFFLCLKKKKFNTLYIEMFKNIQGHSSKMIHLKKKIQCRISCETKSFNLNPQTSIFK